MRPGMGWGYDCAVVFDPKQIDEVVGTGTFFWWDWQTLGSGWIRLMTWFLLA
jgi:hypothetical protein